MLCKKHKVDSFINLYPCALIDIQPSTTYILNSNTENEHTGNYENVLKMQIFP